MSADLVITNARIIGRKDEIAGGSLAVRDGVIADIGAGPSAVGSAEDFGGDYLLPGLVELHTDNLEKHFAPRPGVRWPAKLAVINHDAQVAAAGITTVMDAVAVGDVREGSVRLAILRDMIAAIEEAQKGGMLRAEHLLHLRCEISFRDLMQLIEPMSDLSWLKLVSIMDHTPGQRQFVNPEKYRQYYQGKFGLTDEEMDRFMAEQIANAQAWGAENRRKVVALCHAKGLPLASHDDATAEHVAEAAADRMVVAEFPTTHEAAKLSRQHGMKVMMGGPNVVRGGSHSGNISAKSLAEKGELDIISSDYVPSSMLQSVFLLPEQLPGISLPQAVAMASSNPADAVGLTDRGAIETGKRADLLRISLIDDTPVVRAVWRSGKRVM
ncbi:alpha-D-ribose 1-methylphosphonate 5-triphosphate diphosphatase [Ferrovibrio terrae]|uniref:Alpha-D-ribose 1-methylphosphonate 5-triphosphate diphosphatase n=1 Tax=Ferrovibrio terrae TaxID=2594003 RepID=A0A516H138_9PROT|nr:alpha-D-ribose 1-methylphosphonate 5-triphosphate diphosphatase [Ferrovibrio terrae]QDO97499.1 alpha-D-ribose 1-methylphosphonate 5-triphosphate diphosphatase [Ferrovibrio terrae]